MGFAQTAFKFGRLFLICAVAALLSACDKTQSENETQAVKPSQSSAQPVAQPLAAASQPTGQPQASLAKEEKPLPKCEDAKQGGPEEVVRTLYQQHSIESNKPIIIQPKKVLAKFFDGTLTGLIIKDQECQDRTHEMCNISFDFMYAAQDADVKDFQVCAMNASDKTVRVQFRNFGDPTVINYRLSDTDAGWRISDVQGTADSYEFSLTKLLSQD